MGTRKKGKERNKIPVSIAFKVTVSLYIVDLVDEREFTLFEGGVRQNSVLEFESQLVMLLCKETSQL